MSATPQHLELRCPSCSWGSVCSHPMMREWLRGVKMLRRDSDPPVEFLVELFRTSASKFVCPECDHSGLSVTAAEDEDDESWGVPRPCEQCGAPISRERLEALPGTRLCVRCQGQSDRGEDTQEPQYCPRCGSVMTLVQSRAPGITRYVMRCSACGK